MAATSPPLLDEERLQDVVADEISNDINVALHLDDEEIELLAHRIACRILKIKDE